MIDEYEEPSNDIDQLCLQLLNDKIGPELHLHGRSMAQSALDKLVSALQTRPKSLTLFFCTDCQLTDHTANMICNALAKSHKQLRDLSFSSNSLMNIPMGVSLLTSLHHLSLSGNRITNLMPLAECKWLQSLSIRHGALESFPEALGQALVNLTHLDISNNRLVSLEFAVHMKRLKSLVAAENKIVALPRDLRKLTSLAVLDLSGNLLTDISALEGCDSLRQLYIECNRISVIPDFLANHPNIGSLWVHGNPLPGDLADTNAKYRALRTLRENSKKNAMALRALITGTLPGPGLQSPLFRSFGRSPLYDKSIWITVRQFLPAT